MPGLEERVMQELCESRLVLELLESRNLLTSLSSSLLRDIAPGASTKFVSQNDGLLYFDIDDERWQTDGTEAGTRPATDFTYRWEVPEAMTRGRLTNSMGTFYFVTEEGQNTLYRAEDPEGQGSPVANFGTHDSVFQSRLFGDKIFVLEESREMFANVRAWISDGTAEGTFQLQEEFVTYSVPYIRPVGLSFQTEINEYLFYGHEDRMFRTDGTQEGSEEVQVGEFVGTVEGIHYFETKNGLDIVGTTDGVTYRTPREIFESTAANPQEPGLAPPPFGTFFGIFPSGGLYRNVTDGRDSAAYSLLRDGEFQHLMTGEISGSRGVRAYPTYDTWYGVGSNFHTHELSIYRVGEMEPVDSECPATNWCWYDERQNVVIHSDRNKPVESPLIYSSGFVDSERFLFSLNGSRQPELLKTTDGSVLLAQSEGLTVFVDGETPNSHVWVTDGSSETVQLVEVADGRALEIVDIASTDDKIVMIVTTEETGQELWTLDGSLDYDGLLAEVATERFREGTAFTPVASTNRPASELTFAWDLNNDGEFDDAIGPAPVIDWDSFLDVMGHCQDFCHDNKGTLISVRVSDADGNAIEQKSLIFVSNVSPDKPSLFLDPAALPVAGTPTEFFVTSFDHGGSLSYAFDFGDGTGTNATANSNASHTYSEPGIYSVAVSAIDSFGAVSRTTESITVIADNPQHTWVFEPNVVFGENQDIVDIDLVDSDGDGRTNEAFLTDRGRRNSVVSIIADNRTVLVESGAQYGTFSSRDWGSRVGSVVGDINGNGQWQAVVGSSKDGLESWPSMVNAEVHDLALADFDSDSDLDLFVASSQGDQLFVNDGDASLLTGTNYRSSQPMIGRETKVLAVGDVNGDGTVDVVTASDSAITTLINDGLGGMTVGESEIIASVSHLALGDFDGDDDLDLFATGEDASRVWLNNGAGVFLDTLQPLGPGNSSHVALGDLDSDGDLDAFVSNGEGVANRVWLNDGAGRFHDAGVRLESSRSTISTALGDIDNDGDLDLISVNESDVSQVYLNRSSDTVEPMTADFNADGSIGFADFLILSTNFGKTEAVPADGDVDTNGVVDFSDFLMLLSSFGESA